MTANSWRDIAETIGVDVQRRENLQRSGKTQGQKDLPPKDLDSLYKLITRFARSGLGAGMHFPVKLKAEHDHLYCFQHLTARGQQM